MLSLAREARAVQPLHRAHAHLARLVEYRGDWEKTRALQRHALALASLLHYNTQMAVALASLGRSSFFLLPLHSMLLDANWRRAPPRLLFFSFLGD